MLALLATLSGCATPPPADDPDAVAEYKETNDPLEPTNRVVYAVNQRFDSYIFRPLAEGYRWILPQEVRDRAHNVLDNIGMPTQAMNDMFQGHPRKAGDSLMRLVTNTTIGLGGMFDPATALGWPNHDSDSGITLAVWGMPSGPYIYLPFFGPSSPREGIGQAMDFGLDPFTWVQKTGVMKEMGYVRFGVSALDARSRVIEDLDKVTNSALDPYATIRSLARQHRQSQVDDAQDDNPRTIPAWFPQPSAATKK
jgi:phospholipid-binding lipoprotein MlaA